MLIADDEKITREFIRFVVEKYRIPVEVAGEAYDGAEAVRLGALLRPDVVCMDIRMPVLDGLSAAEKIVEVSPDIVNIVITAYDEFELAQRALRLGAFDYLVKPIRPEELARVLDKAIEKIEMKGLQSEKVPQYQKDSDTYSFPPPEVVTSEAELFQCVRLGDVDGAQCSSETLLRMLLEGKRGSLVWEVVSELREMMSALVHAAVQGGAFPGEVRKVQAECLKRLGGAKGTDEIEGVFKGFIEHLLESVVDAQRRNVGGRIERVKDFIERSFQRASLRDVAEIMCTTPPYASRLFRERVGLSFKDYLAQVRVKEAKKLLSATELSIREISERVGYEDAGYFSRIFRKITGKSPREFRRQAGNG